MLIRDEIPSDVPAIGRVVTEAMRLLPEATGTEAAISPPRRRGWAIRTAGG